MGIQIWSSNQAPQIQMAGVNALAQGIGMAGQSLGDSLGKAMEQRKTNSNLATALRKKLGILNPDRKEEFNTMGLPELTGEDMAHAEGVLEKRRKMQEEEFLQRQQEHVARMEAERQRAEQERGFAGAISGLTKPDNATLGDYFENPENYPQGQPKSRAPSLQEILGAAAQHGQLLNPNLDNIIRALEPKQTSMIGPEALKQFGFVPTGGQVNPNGSASLTFGPPAPPTPTSIIPLPVQGGGASGKGLWGDKVVDIQAPNSEGKTLTQSENQMLGALNQAGTDLDNLDKIFKKLGKDWGGPLAGRALNAAGVGQNPDIVAVENAINAATPNLARGVFREVGVLTDEDIRRYKALLPTAYDTDAVRSVKMKQLRERIEQGKKETMDSLRKAGRDVSGFDKAAKAEATKPPPNAAGKTHAQLIEEANAAIQGGADEKAVRQRLKDLGVEVK